MKRGRFMRSSVFGLFLFLVVIAGVWAAAQVAAALPWLSRGMRGGALLYLESADFGAQLRDWDRSSVNAKWIASKNHEQFLTTRLALKLKDAYQEFSAAAGFSPDTTEL